MISNKSKKLGIGFIFGVFLLVYGIIATLLGMGYISNISPYMPQLILIVIPQLSVFVIQGFPYTLEIVLGTFLILFSRMFSVRRR